MNCETKEEAKKRGRKLLMKMKGKGWKLRVWENMGWHYCVRNGGLNVYPCHNSRGKEAYHAMLAPNFDGSGDLAMWSGKKFFSSKDPNKAVKHKLKEARKVVDGLNSVVTKAEKVL